MPTTVPFDTVIRNGLIVDGSGLPAFSIVGLPETAVKESKDRVRAALANCGFDLPSGHITVNLAPADLKKEGPGFDLPVAITILADQCKLTPESLAETAMIGELALNGELRPVRGLLAVALEARAGEIDPSTRLGLSGPRLRSAATTVVRGLSPRCRRPATTGCRN